MQAMLEQEDLAPETLPWEAVMDEILYQCNKEERCDLPQTGFPWTVEHELSSIFILPTTLLGKSYGTQTQTVVAGWLDGVVEYREKVLHSVLEGADSLPKLSRFQLPVQISQTWHLDPPQTC
jgi:uncharacterized protein with NRDE domain